MRRRWIVLALVASVLAIVAAGCGGDEEAAPPAAPAEPAPAEPAPAEPAPAEPAPAEPAPAEPAPAEENAFGASVENGTYGENYDPDPALVEKALISVDALPDDQDARNIVLAALARAKLPVDINQALECWQNNGCDTGTGGELTVAETDGFGGNVWRQVLKMEFILQALSYPQVGKIIYTDANLDTQKAISDFRSVIAQGADVIIGYADAGDALLPQIKEATDRGIPYITYANGPVGEPGIDYLTVTGPDQCGVGVSFAEALNEALPEGGKIAYLGGTPGNPISPTWQNCETENLNDNFEVLGSVDTNWTRQGALEGASGFLAQHPDIKAWSYDYADGAVGLLRAYEAADHPFDFVLTVQSDEQSLMCEAQQIAPDMPIYHFSGLNSQGRMALTAGMMALAGAPIPPNIVIKSTLKKADESSCVAEIPSEGSPTSTVPLDLYQLMFPS